MPPDHAGLEPHRRCCALHFTGGQGPKKLSGFPDVAEVRQTLGSPVFMSALAFTQNTHHGTMSHVITTNSLGQVTSIFFLTKPGNLHEGRGISVLVVNWGLSPTSP